MRQFNAALILTATASLAATALAGCTTATVIDSLPSAIGEPAAAPARPVADTYQYPAVHDMPPPRPDQLLTEEQEVKMERDLENARDRQEAQAGVKPAKKAAKPLKPAPAAAGGVQTTGDKSNP